MPQTNSNASRKSRRSEERAKVGRDFARNTLRPGFMRAVTRLVALALGNQRIYGRGDCEREAAESLLYLFRTGISPKCSTSQTGTANSAIAINRSHVHGSVHGGLC